MKKTITLELALSVLNSMEIASHHNGSLQEQIHNAKTVEEKHNLEVLQAKQQKEVNELKDILINNASTDTPLTENPVTYSVKATRKSNGEVWYIYDGTKLTVVTANGVTILNM